MTRTKIMATVAIILWAITIGVGFVWVVDYSVRPGRAAISPPRLPFDSSLKRQKNLPTLFLFAHPQCPCSRATLAELARLMAHNQGRVNVQVLFYQPINKPRQWVESDLWQQAVKIPGVAVSTISELELLRAGVATSGQTLLYDTAGNLIFSGGITLGRGHEGDNLGRTAIGTYLHTGTIPTTQTPVFGCSVTEDE